MLRGTGKTGVKGMTSMARTAWAHHRRRAFAAFIVTAGATFLGSVWDAASAEDYSFQAVYRVTLNGLAIGKANLAGRFNGTEYRIDGQGRLTGIAGALFEYSGSAAATGRIRNGRTSPSAFSADASDGKRATSVRMNMVDDGVRRIELDPKPKPHQVNHPARVQITAAHKRGVIDPISALITPGGFDGENFDRSICNRSVPIFNGRERFDVKLEYKGVQVIQGSGNGAYSGPVLVCQARYRPIAGHRSDKEEVNYVAEKVIFEVLLAPLAGSDLVVPYRGTVSTMLGSAAIQATSLVAKGALRTRSAALVE